MAYQLKRATKIEEVVALGDSGETISINLNVGQIARDFNTRYNAIVRAQLEIKQLGDGKTPEALEKVMISYGEALISLFQLVFGEEGTAKVLAFYQHNYLEMTGEVFPFIIDVVMPKISAHAQATRERLRQQYRKG
jgi:hypothetical protein